MDWESTNISPHLGAGYFPQHCSVYTHTISKQTDCVRLNPSGVIFDCVLSRPLSLTLILKMGTFLFKWSESPSVVYDSLQPGGLYNPWNSQGQNTAVGSFSLLRGIFPTQGANLGLPHYRKIFYQLSHKGSPRILEWVVYPFSSGSSWPRNQTGISYIAGGFFTDWAIREAPSSHKANTIIRFTCTLLPQMEAFLFLLYYLFYTK